MSADVRFVRPGGRRIGVPASNRVICAHQCEQIAEEGAKTHPDRYLKWLPRVAALRDILLDRRRPPAENGPDLCRSSSLQVTMNRYGHPIPVGQPCASHGRHCGDDREPNEAHPAEEFSPVVVGFRAETLIADGRSKLQAFREQPIEALSDRKALCIQTECQTGPCWKRLKCFVPSHPNPIGALGHQTEDMERM
jgi:hypothetical protein